MTISLNDPDPRHVAPLLRAIFGSSPDAIGIAREGIVHMANRAMVELFGHDSEDAIVGHPVLALIAPQSREHVAEIFRRRVTGEEVPSVYVPTGLRADGSEFSLEVRSAAYRVRGEAYHLAFLRERRESPATEQATDRGADFYRAVFEVNTAVKLLIAPSTGRIVDANPAAAEFYGWPLETLRTMRITDINILSRDEVHAEMQAAAAGNRRYFRFRHRTASGEIRHVEVHSGPLEVEDGHLLFSIVHDVTERDRLQEELLRAQRMEAVGRLAGGVAHDFNNLLTVLLTSADLLGRKLEPDSPLRPHVEDLRQAAQRGADLTHGLLAFSRRQVMRPRPVRLNDLVERMLRLLRRTITPTVEIRSQLAADLPPVQADPSQLEQVVMNLVLNARDAMPERGVMTLRSEWREIDGAETVPSGPWVTLSVSDTGTGMDAQTRARVFEPFFTTKGPGEGTGLGLATVYGIVTQSGGHVTVESAPGSGTSFTVYLPPADDEPATPRAVARVNTAPGARRTVLLAEDVTAVRAVVADALEGAGFRVLRAGSADEALALADSHLAEIDALVTDVVMPGRSGVELAQVLLGRRPELRVVLISGHVRDHDRTQLPEQVVFVHKPFVADDLVGVLRDLFS
jgi:two-component system, cell cycle sensor histidine kinase and response regulator CckA